MFEVHFQKLQDSLWITFLISLGFLLLEACRITFLAPHGLEAQVTHALDYQVSPHTVNFLKLIFICCDKLHVYFSICLPQVNAT